MEDDGSPLNNFGKGLKNCLEKAAEEAERI